MKKLSERVTLGASKAMRIGRKLGWDVKKRASGRTDYVTFTKDGKKYGPVDASILTQEFLMRKLKEKLKEKFASKAQQRYLYATDPEAAEKLGDKMTKKDYKELPDKVNEDFSQRARNFRVHLRQRLKDLKPGKKVKIDKLVFKKLPSGDGFTDKRGKFFDHEQVVQAIQKGPALNMISQNSVRSPRGKEQVDAYVKFEGKLTEASSKHSSYDEVVKAIQDFAKKKGYKIPSKGMQLITMNPPSEPKYGFSRGTAIPLDKKIELSFDIHGVGKVFTLNQRLQLNRTFAESVKESKLTEAKS